MTSTLHESQYKFFICRSILLRTRNVSDKRRRRNQNTHYVFSNFFSSKILPFLDNGEKYCIGGRSQMKIQHMHIACWLPKSPNTQYVIIIAFPLQQWLHEHASMLRYTYIACQVYSCSQVYNLLSNIS
jgi:hypothetical protein